MGATPWYASRERVKRASDIDATATADAEIDDACAAATTLINRTHHRCHYWPQVATRYFDWPNMQHALYGKLWLDDNWMISISGITAGGVAVPANDWVLYPASGPPYTKLEANLAGTGLFTTGPSGYQNSIGVTGLYGHSNDTVPGGALAEPLDLTETAVDVADGSRMGVGDLLELTGGERCVVTGRDLLDTTVNTSSSLTDLPNAASFTVADGTLLHVGEEVVVDSETMLIVGIAGNTVQVRRAYSGSVLAAHLSGADVYASRRLTVERGSLGTTAATHADGSAVVRWAAPAPIVALGTGVALALYRGQAAGWADTVGQGETATAAQGVGVGRLWLAADSYRRKARHRAV